MAHARPRSGKPTGRPRGSTSKHKLKLQALAREYTEVALRTLVEICRRGDTDKARVDAADKLLDRGWGKPVQAIHGSGDDGEHEVNLKHGVSDELQSALDQIARKLSSGE